VEADPLPRRGEALVTRSEQLNRQYRKILLVSFLAAGLLHAAVVLVNPGFRVEVVEPTRVRLRLELVFPEPEILSVDGSEPGPGLAQHFRVVNWTQVQMSLRENWPEAYRLYRIGGAASLRILVDSTGRVLEAELVESSGDPTKDRAFLVTVKAARYRPIGSDFHWQEMEFVQPLRVEQPLTPLQLWVARSSGDSAR
jgi:TonB family protein